MELYDRTTYRGLWKTQDRDPHWAGGVRGGWKQDAALLSLWWHGQHSKQVIGGAAFLCFRMETTGQPMKIHISMETKLLLDTLGRFFTEHRGLVDVKGKVVAHIEETFLNCYLQGKLDTYWLLGKEGGLGKQRYWLKKTADQLETQGSVSTRWTLSIVQKKGQPTWKIFRRGRIWSK